MSAIWKGARSEACNLKFESDFAKGLFDYCGCSSLVTNFRKNDQERKGHWMRFGKSADPDLNLDPRTSSGCSQATPRTVSLAAMCGSQTRTASTTPGAPSAASRIRPGAVPGSSPLPPPPPGEGGRAATSGGLVGPTSSLQTVRSTLRHTLFAWANPELQWMAFLYGPRGLAHVTLRPLGARSRDSPRLPLGTLPRLTRPRSR
jgi:hypothetical protein